MVVSSMLMGAVLASLTGGERFVNSVKPYSAVSSSLSLIFAYCLHLSSDLTYYYFVSVGFIVDFIGRRLAIVINSVVFLVGAIMLALAPSFAVLVCSFISLSS